MSKKTPEDILIDRIADDFQTYLMKGICLDSFSSKIDPNLRINDVEKLLRIHFVLTEKNDSSPGVIDFIKKLPPRLRKLKTSIKKVNEVHHGQIRGKIDWQDTIKKRSKTNVEYNTTYSCLKSNKNFQIKENLVLKELLSIIYEIVFNDLKPALEKDERYEWLKDWTSKKDRNLKSLLKNVYLKNIYLERVENERVNITKRTINQVKKSRNQLYQEAARLLERYRRLMNFELEKKEAKELMRNTFIHPEKREVLFELYWAFRILNSFENVTYHIIEEGINAIANWSDNNFNYIMYHDSKGSNQLNFLIKFENIEEDIEKTDENGYLFRLGEFTKEWGELTEDIFSITSNQHIWSGNPDIIIERYDKETDELDKIFIAEVKDTVNKRYAITGLRELLEYMSLVMENDDYFEKGNQLFEGEKIKGALFVDNVEKIDSHNYNFINVIRVSDYPENKKIDKSIMF